MLFSKPATSDFSLESHKNDQRKIFFVYPFFFLLAVAAIFVASCFGNLGELNDMLSTIEKRWYSDV